LCTRAADQHADLADQHARDAMNQAKQAGQAAACGGCANDRGFEFDLRRTALPSARCRVVPRQR
jgi:hypothetical protein